MTATTSTTNTTSSTLPASPALQSTYLFQKNTQVDNHSSKTFQTNDLSDSDYRDSDSDSDSDYYSDSDDEDLEEIEKEMLCFQLQEQRKRRASHNDALSQLLKSSESTSRDGSTTNAPRLGAAAVDTRASMSCMPSRRNDNVQDLFARMSFANKHNFYFQDATKKDRVKSVTEVQAAATVSDETTVPQDPKRPDVFLVQTLKISNYITQDTLTSDSWEPYFTAVTPERVAAHSLVVAKAIRRADLCALKALRKQGAKLNGCNKQGESSIHLACRIGNLSVLKFLVNIASVSVRVRDDQGKTPLHDACWTASPNFQVIHFILNQAPELLFLTDHRGYTALHYVPAECQDDWVQWIDEHQEWLRRKVHDSTWIKARDQLDDAQKRLRNLMEKAANYT